MKQGRNAKSVCCLHKTIGAGTVPASGQDSFKKKKTLTKNIPDKLPSIASCLIKKYSFPANKQE
jgi:hypothetical protein